MSESETKGRCRSELNAAYQASRFKPNDSDVVIVDAIDRLAADVASIKAKIDAVSPEDVKHFVESEKAWVAILEQDRDKMKDERNTAIMQREAAIRKRDEARAEVERLRMQLAACGVLADCNTTDSLERNRRMHPDYDCASVQSVIRAVEREIGLLAEVERLKAELAERPDANYQEITDSSPADPPPAGWLTDEERRILSAHAQSLRDQRRAMERGGQTLGYSADSCGLKREADAIDAILARAGSPPAWLTQEERVAMERARDFMQLSSIDLARHTAGVLDRLLARAGSPPVAPPAGWLTDSERRAVAYFAEVCRDDLVPDEWTVHAGVLRSFLARAGSPPVVEVPDLPSNFYARSEAERYRAALDKAGLKWKEVGRVHC